jgi:hypothetical protein
MVLMVLRGPAEPRLLVFHQWRERTHMRVAPRIRLKWRARTGSLNLATSVRSETVGLAIPFPARSVQIFEYRVFGPLQSMELLERCPIVGCGAPEKGHAHNYNDMSPTRHPLDSSTASRKLRADRICSRPLPLRQQSGRRRLPEFPSGAAQRAGADADAAARVLMGIARSDLAKGRDRPRSSYATYPDKAA